MANLRSNGRPEPEVIAQFADGFSYSKGKMEDAFRTLQLDKPLAKPPKEKETVAIRREDVDLLVREFEITRTQAEKHLAEAGGNIETALQRIVSA